MLVKICRGPSDRIPPRRLGRALSTKLRVASSAVAGIGQPRLSAVISVVRLRDRLHELSATPERSARFRPPTYCFFGWRLRSRTPGPPPFSSMNSTPAASNVRCSASIVLSFKSSPRSNLATVSVDTLAAAATSRTPKPSAARAMRHCTGDIIITMLRFRLQLRILAVS
jgi:hypothetical protein